MRTPLATLVALSVTLVLSSGRTPAQSSTPQVIKVQGFLSQNSGGTVTPVNGPVTMAFALYDADPGGTLIGSVGPMSVDVTNGIYEADLPFAAGAFSAPTRYIEVSVNGQALAPRLRLASAPFAYVTQSLNGFGSDDFVKKTGDTMTGTLQVAGTVLSSSGGFTFPDGTVQTTAATKAILGNTLDQAYNQGGPGAGRTINANAGPVAIAGSDGLAVNGPVSAAGGVVLPSGAALRYPDGTVGLTGRTPMQIATLHWYDVSTQTIFPVGSGPVGLAFDGTNIWVTNQGSGTVMRLRVFDGANFGAITVGSLPSGVAFDGANIWVANQGSGTVTKLRDDGLNLGTFPVGSGPTGVVFDGTSVWVANTNSSNLTRLRATDGLNIGTFVAGSNPSGMAFDGANLWVANRGSNNVTELRASDGANLGTFTVGTGPQGVAFDGSSIWVANRSSNSLTRLRASDGANLGTVSLPSGPQSLAFDGSSIWATIANDNVTKVRASDGTIVGTFSVGPVPLGVAFDGTNIWVANFLSNTLSKL